MTHIVENILIGFSNFPFFAVLFTLPVLVLPVIHYKKINFVRVGLNYLFILYLLCLTALVFFPLPDAKQMAALSTYDMQLIPFHFIADILKESKVVITNPKTYVAAFTNRAVWQVVFNIVMMVPFGMYLRYYFSCTTKQVVMITCALSFCIEITQLTGCFFLYNGSYRLCDVDDLIANTLGGFTGCMVVNQMERVMPGIHEFDLALPVPVLFGKSFHRI